METDLINLNPTKGTYSVSAALTLSIMLSLFTPQNIGANSTVISNTQQPKYDIEITSPVAVQATTITIWEDQMTEEFKPKTDFVKKLLVLREKAIINGMSLLNVDEILTEKRALRGEIE